MTREIIDLTHPITEDLPSWPGDAQVRVWRQTRLSEGQSNTSGITLGSHAGTHLDAPFHWFEDGARVEATPLERLVGPARVVDLRGSSPTITAVELRSAYGTAGAGERLLLLTGWQGRLTDGDWSGLSREAAEWLRDQQPALIGTDAPSIDAPNAGHAHEALLGAQIPVLELLVNLDRLVGRAFELAALPLAVVGTDGAPVRAIAVTVHG